MTKKFQRANKVVHNDFSIDIVYRIKMMMIQGFSQQIAPAQ